MIVFKSKKKPNKFINKINVISFVLRFNIPVNNFAFWVLIIAFGSKCAFQGLNMALKRVYI